MRKYFILHSHNGRWLQELTFDKDKSSITNGTVSFTFFSDDNSNSHYYKQVPLDAPCPILNLNDTITSIATSIKEELVLLSKNIKSLRRSLPIFKSKIDWFVVLNINFNREKIVFAKVTESLKTTPIPANGQAGIK